MDGGARTMILTVASVFVQGEYPYTPEYVAKLYAMVDRWIDRPYRAVCLTDRPELIPTGVEALPIAKLAGFAPWSKLELINPIRQWPGRVLYLDLDSLVVGPLGHLIDTPAPFVITADPVGKTGRDSYGHAIVRRFNSSVMAWDGGTQTDLYTNWKPKVAERLSGDQDWIGEQRPHAQTWPRAWFPRISELKDNPPVQPASVVLCKVPKNTIAVERWPWVRQAWQ
jgi:hypothetical protein